MRSTTQKRRRRFVRPLAIAGSAIALAAPATAGAVQLDSTLPAAHNYAQQPAPDQVGARLDHRGLNHRSTPYTTTVRTQAASDDSETLAIVLASSALGLVLLGSGYAAVSAGRIGRRLGATQ